MLCILYTHSISNKLLKEQVGVILFGKYYSNHLRLIVGGQQLQCCNVIALLPY